MKKEKKKDQEKEAVITIGEPEEEGADVLDAEEEPAREAGEYDPSVGVRTVPPEEGIRSTAAKAPQGPEPREHDAPYQSKFLDELQVQKEKEDKIAADLVAKRRDDNAEKSEED